MKKTFTVSFTRSYDVEIETDDLEYPEQEAEVEAVKLFEQDLPYIIIDPDNFKFTTYEKETRI